MQILPKSSTLNLFLHCNPEERHNWGPLEAGRFASGHALAGFCGNMLAGRLLQFLGKRLYVTVTNLLTLGFSRSSIFLRNYCEHNRYMSPGKQYTIILIGN